MRKKQIHYFKIQSTISYLLLCSFLTTALLPAANVSGRERVPEVSVSDSDIEVSVPTDTDADIAADTEQVLTIDLASESVTAASGTTVGETVAAKVSGTLKAIDFYNDVTIANLLAKSRYSAFDILNKRTEMHYRTGRPLVEISEEEALAELKSDYLKEASFGEAFQEVQDDIERIVTGIVDHSKIPDGVSDAADYFENRFLNDKEKILLGLAYLYRLYDFDMGQTNIKDVLIYNPSAYGKNVDSISWLIQIGNAGGEKLKISNNTNMFGWGNLFYTVTSSANLNDFLEENRQKYLPNRDLDTWFETTSRAMIIETYQEKEKDTRRRFYSRLWSDKNLRSHILPLLSVSDNSIYVIVNQTSITYGIVDCYVDRDLLKTDPALYDKKIDQFIVDVENTARQQEAYVALWKRIAKPEMQTLIASDRLVYDSLRIYRDRTTNAESEWSPRSGDEAATGVREFFVPLNLYVDFMNCDGMATGIDMRLYLAKALTERGLSTYNHELTHLWIPTVMLNNYGIRDGMEAEVYTRGMFETYQGNDPLAFNLNLIFDRSNKDNRYHNAVPERFEDVTDLREYMKGILDVVYTLDYAEAQAILGKSSEEKRNWFHKLDQVIDTGKRSNPGEGLQHKIDSVRRLTLEEASELNTLEDLIDCGVLASRYEVNGTETVGEIPSNGYYVVPLFSSNYAAVQNDAGVSGDVMIKRQAFELLAEYGYYGGMVPYISNLYKNSAKSENKLFSDTYILNKIFDGQYTTMADFKKAMFQRRIDRTEYLKPVTIEWESRSITIDSFEVLQGLMQDAVEWDLEHVHEQSNNMNNIRAESTHTERLKAKIFQAYLFQTDDFKESIYKDGIEPDPEPKPDPNPNPAPNPEPASEPKDTKAEEAVVPSVGTVLAKENVQYVVTKIQGTESEVSYVKCDSRTATVQIPDSIMIDGILYKVTSIENNAFKGNSKVKKIIVGKNIRRIGKKAFYKCKKLKKIVINSTVLKSVGANAVKGIHENAVIKVPKKKYNKYKKLFTSKTGMKKTMSVKK